MIQNQDYLWKQPCPLPLRSQPGEEQNVTLPLEAQAAVPPPVQQRRPSSRVPRMNISGCSSSDACPLSPPAGNPWSSALSTACVVPLAKSMHVTRRNYP